MRRDHNLIVAYIATRLCVTRNFVFQLCSIAIVAEEVTRTNANGREISLTLAVRWLLRLFWRYNYIATSSLIGKFRSYDMVST